MKKKTISLLLILCLLCCGLPPVLAAQTEDGVITLYVAPEGSGVTVPADKPASFKLRVPGDPADYQAAVLGESVEVRDLTVVPHTETFTVLGGMDGSVSQQTGYLYGESIVEVFSRTTGYAKTYRFCVEDYSDTYVDDFVDAYIRDNIPASLTAREKLERVAAFIASYDYSVYHQSLKGMLLSGEGGDCWASTDAAIIFARRLGYRARVCADQSVSLFTGGHTYAVVFADGVNYVVEAGYAGVAPRYYSVEALESPFRFSENGDGTCTLERYLGCERDIVVPDTWSGMPVTGVAAQCFYLADRYIEGGLRSVRLPETVKKLGASCFYDCGDLETLNLPRDLETVDMSAFIGCKKLALSVPAGSRFTAKDGVLYSADGKTLVCAYAPGEGRIEVPEGVEKIADGAFYAYGLDGITFPSTLRDIGYAAFRNADFGRTSVVLPEGVTGIGGAAFDSSGVTELTILNPAAEINNTRENDIYQQENGITLNCTSVICGLPGSTAEAYAKKYGNEDPYAYTYSAPCGAVLQDGAHRFAAHTCAEETLVCTVCGRAFENTTAHEYVRRTPGYYGNARDPFFYGECGVCGRYNVLPMDVEKLVPGDADFDGRIRAADARIALRAAVGLEYADGVLYYVVNVDGDENISAADARRILRAAVGLENPQSK